MRIHHGHAVVPTDGVATNATHWCTDCDEPSHPPVPTKWSVLVARTEQQEREAERARDYLNGLDATPCGLTCSGCGEHLTTEGDFARHFGIPDTRYLNLGFCPIADAHKRVRDTSTKTTRKV